MSFRKNHFHIHKISSLVNNLELGSECKNKNICEFDERGYSFEAPLKTCVHGQLIGVEAKLTILAVEHDFYSTGKVVRVQPLLEGMGVFTVELYRHETYLWKAFLEAQNHNQREVENLFFSMRDFE